MRHIKLSLSVTAGSNVTTMNERGAIATIKMLYYLCATLTPLCYPITINLFYCKNCWQYVCSLYLRFQEVRKRFTSLLRHVPGQESVRHHCKPTNRPKVCCVRSLLTPSSQMLEAPGASGQFSLLLQEILVVCLSVYALFTL